MHRPVHPPLHPGDRTGSVPPRAVALEHERLSLPGWGGHEAVAALERFRPELLATYIDSATPSGMPKFVVADASVALGIEPSDIEVAMNANHIELLIPDQPVSDEQVRKLAVRFDVGRHQIKVSRGAKTKIVIQRAMPEPES